MQRIRRLKTGSVLNSKPGDGKSAVPLKGPMYALSVRCEYWKRLIARLADCSLRLPSADRRCRANLERSNAFSSYEFEIFE